MQCLAGLVAYSHSPLLLLRFLYSDEVQIGPETVMTTLYTAKKYAVPALEAHCVEFLKKHLRADNAFMLLTQVSVLMWYLVTPGVLRVVRVVRVTTRLAPAVLSHCPLSVCILWRLP